MTIKGVELRKWFIHRLVQRHRTQLSPSSTMAESYFVITNGKIMLETIRLGVGDRVSNLIYQEVSGASTTTKIYTWGNNLLKSSDGYFIYDANENVSKVINSLGGVEAHYEYDPFGNVVVATGALASENEFQFSTKYYDFETGLNYYGYRYYSPNLGRWINRDPIEEQGGLNLYGFVFNNAISIVDIDGRQTFSGSSFGDSLMQDLFQDLMDAIEDFFKGTKDHYCRYGSATISVCLDLSSVAVVATGAAIAVLSISNNVVSASICGNYTQAAASSVLAGVGLKATNVKTAAGLAAADIILNVGPIVLE